MSRPQEVIARPGWSLHFLGSAKWLIILGVCALVYLWASNAAAARKDAAARKVNQAARTAQNP